jgi:hypothetical protein
MLAKGKSIQEIKRLLDARNLRGRSGNLFTEREIRAVPKPVYAGMIPTRSGRWVKSAFYAPIVSLKVLKGAQRALRRLTEGVDFPVPAIGEGVFLTARG